jgi:hypothetical protein
MKLARAFLRPITVTVLPIFGCFGWLPSVQRREFRGAVLGSLSRSTSSSSATTTDFNVTENVDSVSSSNDQPRSPLCSLLGGDFAGHVAECDGQTGRAKPVPVYLVPKSMLEWGQHPTSLEVLMSEEQQQGDDDDLWTRVCLTIMPETGCGVDNLEVQKTAEEGWRRLTTGTDGDPRVAGLIRETNPTLFTVETVFALPTEEEDDPRLRVRLEVTGTSLGRITLAWERRFAATSTHGTRADGGGLDGASVNRWMGRTIAVQGPRMFAAESVVESEVEDAPQHTQAAWQTLHLPANVTLQHGISPDDAARMVLQVTHLDGASLRYEWELDEPNSIKVV